VDLKGVISGGCVALGRNDCARFTVIRALPQELLGHISGADGRPLYFAGDGRPLVMADGLLLG